MSILNLLEEIGADTKKIYKTDLVKKNKDNKLFLDVVNLALNPYTQFYIRKIPEYTSNGANQSLDWALPMLNLLSSRQLTGHAGIEHLRNILSSVHPDDAIVIERIIGKDLRCGLADGLVNDAIKDFIPTYPCLLARPYEEKNIKNITYPAYSQLKADGLRANAWVEGSKIFLCGRSGREIDLLGALDIALFNFAIRFPWPVVFDGEFVVVDNNGKVLDRKTGNGIINKAIKGTISEKEAKQIRYQMWDAIPMHEFKAKKSTEDYKTRFERLLAAIDSDAGNPRPYWVIPYKIVNSLDEGIAHFELLRSQGHEGTILKNYCGLWEDSRSKHLVKLKAELECDLEVIGWNPGKGQFEGQVGSLICASSDRLVQVDISGFSEELRLWITEHINEVVGSIVAVLYNERIKSKDKNRAGVDSLFLPRYQEFRSDKTVADSSKEIK